MTTKKTKTKKTLKNFLSTVPNGYAALLGGEDIVIRVNIKALQDAINGASDLMTVDGNWKVTNPKEFALEVIQALNEEDEQGTTPVHQLFDAAFNEVINQGGFGIEEVSEEEDE